MRVRWRGPEGPSTALLLWAAASFLAVLVLLSLVGDIYVHQRGCPTGVTEDICQHLGMRVSFRSWTLIVALLAAGLTAMGGKVLPQRR